MTDDVFDLDAYVAANRQTPYRFRYGGQNWELPGSPKDTDWRVTEAADQGSQEAIRTLFRRGLGPDRWAEFEKLPQPTGAMTELFNRWQQHSGMKPGESQASPDSSESTAGPSTPPFTATTESASPPPSTEVSPPGN
ncbi:hypothetical protein CSH63_17950 [Micromonospora tulbaghiae]|uniref:Uncharacterized protein n=1 Tax=Micromonospora tulbaghiae TaxID=479978 RepID=A0A386WRZ2_9ACTN|nr:hypothetical protein [Micromonospora tulbaghiae]AYF29314.1 hypothetical protein CSH63_17950 [Micromonospora tulbaghiae]